jgi:hypothetical protein
MVLYDVAILRTTRLSPIHKARLMLGRKGSFMLVNLVI